jgi:hypothetical protein
MSRITDASFSQGALPLPVSLFGGEPRMVKIDRGIGLGPQSNLACIVHWV